MPLIDPNRVNEVFLKCLLTQEEFVAGNGNPENVIEGHGVLEHAQFNHERLEEYREEVKAWLDNLPEQFHAKTGGGWTFLNLCQDKEENLWTGSHPICDQLIMLASGLKIGEILGREFADSLPGGVPYVVFNTDEPESSMTM